MANFWQNSMDCLTILWDVDRKVVIELSYTNDEVTWREDMVFHVRNRSSLDDVPETIGVSSRKARFFLTMS